MNTQNDIGILRCEWCSKEVTEHDTHCPHCTGPIRVFHQLYVLCGWCGTSNRRDLTPTCSRCSGPLPSVPGGDAGPKPPSAIRELPKGYDRRVKFTKNVPVILGATFTIVFSWTIVFPIIGVFLWRFGYIRAKRQLKVLREGIPARGKITAVFEDVNVNINNKHPWKIKFEFESSDGTIREGSVEAWDPAQRERVIGEPIWVVYSNDDVKAHSIWPPVK